MRSYYLVLAAVQRGAHVNNLVRDILFGARMLRKNLGFTFAAVAVLALGIGANAAIFSLVNAFLLKPLVMQNPAAVVGCYSRDTRTKEYRGFSYPDYAELREAGRMANWRGRRRVQQLDGAQHGDGGLTEGGGESTRRVFADIISSNYFTTGVPLSQGRVFTAEEERPGSAVTGGDRELQRTGGKTAATAHVLGQTCRSTAELYTIVGIAPEGFTGTTALISPELVFAAGRVRNGDERF